MLAPTGSGLQSLPSEVGRVVIWLTPGQAACFPSHAPMPHRPALNTLLFYSQRCLAPAEGPGAAWVWQEGHPVGLVPCPVMTSCRRWQQHLCWTTGQRTRYTQGSEGRLWSGASGGCGAAISMLFSSPSW